MVSQFRGQRASLVLSVFGVLLLGLTPTLAHAQGRCGGNRSGMGGQQGSILRSTTPFQQNSLGNLQSSLSSLSQQSTLLATLQQQQQNAVLAAAWQQQQQSVLLAALQQQQLQNAQLAALLLQQQQASQLRTIGR